jgi:hypothetical protein
MNSRLLEIRNKIKSLTDTFVSDIFYMLDNIERPAQSIVLPMPMDDNDTELPNPKKRRRSRIELRILIEAAVDTYGADTSDKFIAEKAGITIARIYNEPYSTYLEEARKEYRKKQNAARAVEHKQK